MSHLFFACLGGAVGAGLRYLVGHAAIRFLGSSFPWGTMIVNISGSMAMGVVMGILAKNISIPGEARVFLITGILGGFTTFSAFSLDAISLWERGAGFLAASYVLGSVITSLLSLFLGLTIMRAIL